MKSQSAYEVAEGFQLSPQQRRAWELQEKYPESQFGAQCMVWIREPIQSAEMDRVVGRVRERYEILRTRFGLLEGTSVPVQFAEQRKTGLDEIIDLRDNAGDDVQAEIVRIAQRHWARLAEAPHVPAVSFIMIMLPHNETVLLLTAHALCADATAICAVAREIRSEYASTISPDREVLQYADVSGWLNQLLRNAALEEQGPYWKTHNFSEISFPRMPFERRRQTGPMTFHAQTVECSVPDDMAANLDQLARRLNVPISTVLLTAWLVILHRFGGSDRFLVGVLSSGRLETELSDVVGPLDKCLPLCAEIDADSAFCNLLEQTHVAWEEAKCDHLSFAWEAVGMPALPDRRHIFPVLFSNRESSRGIPLEWDIRCTEECLEPFDLLLATTTEDGGLGLRFSWQADLFSQMDIALLADCYRALLQEIVVAPERPLKEFTFGAMLAEAGSTQSAEQSEWEPIHRLIEDQSRRLPDQVAVVCDSRQITYAELDRRASMVASHLVRVGATTDSIVAVLLPRSIDFVVAILGALKAGAAWLPIEPEVPAERIGYIIRQSGAVAIVTQQNLISSFDHGKQEIVYLDSITEPDSGWNHLPRASVDPHQLAYVIFTSGSTGFPKGVAIEHRNIASYIHSLSMKLNLAESTRYALVSTMAADLGYTAVLAALTSGGCLHIIPSSQVLDAEAFAQYFFASGVDFIKIVPAHMEALCRSFPESCRLPWRYVLLGGEASSWDLVKSVQGFAPRCLVFNHYGPTETTVGVFCGLADPNREAFRGPTVPIGNSLASSTGYILNHNLQPVSAWVSGELFIGGNSVGRGYVGRGDLTAEKFVPDPFCARPGSRMYRTGDLARRRSDDAVEFLGRLDGQVKIRGYRVELGEIEAGLCRHPAVRNAYVTIADDPSMNRQLMAWAAVGATKVKADDLLRFLEQSLPGYMVPATIICVDRLKLTLNGKIDRQAMQAVKPPLVSEATGPADDVEESLLAVWQKVLGVESIGVDDNYFSLGGDSLRVIQVAQEARRYGLTIGATDVLRYQTIRKLRRAMRESLRHLLFPDGIPLLAQSPSGWQIPADSDDAYPVSGVQSFILSKYAENAGSSGMYHIQDCFHVEDASFSPKALEEAFHHVVQRHPALRTRFDLKSVPPMQYVRRELPWAIYFEDISHLKSTDQEAHVRVALLADRAKLFDAGNADAPLFRVGVFLRSKSEFTCMFACHHAILDGWGHRVLVNQLVSAYLNVKSARRVELGNADSTYREFVLLQEAVRNSGKASDFWRAYLSGASDGAALLAEAVSYASGYSQAIETSVNRSLGPECASALIQAARNCAVSMQALLLGAWFETLHQWAEGQPVVIGVLVNGRSEYLTDPLSAVGLFWNIVPVISRKPRPLREQAAAVQSELIEIEPYAAYPLPHLLATEGGDLFFSTFRYLNFWNTKPVPEESGIRILDIQAHDRYSFPLNCTAGMYALGGGYLQLDFDPARISADRVNTLLDHYKRILEQIARELPQTSN